MRLQSEDVCFHIDSSDNSVNPLVTLKLKDEGLTAAAAPPVQKLWFVLGSKDRISSATPGFHQYVDVFIYRSFNFINSTLNNKWSTGQHVSMKFLETSLEAPVGRAAFLSRLLPPTPSFLLVITNLL